jgi:ABC-type multidrug transport system ATPase subunit
MSLGVCPQFDLLWPELTVEEHLLFYARLKGVPKELERTRVQQSMKEVKLTPFFQ